MSEFIKHALAQSRACSEFGLYTILSVPIVFCVWHRKGGLARRLVPKSLSVQESHVKDNSDSAVCVYSIGYGLCTC